MDAVAASLNPRPDDVHLLLPTFRLALPLQRKQMPCEKTRPCVHGHGTAPHRTATWRGVAWEPRSSKRTDHHIQQKISQRAVRPLAYASQHAIFPTYLADISSTLVHGCSSIALRVHASAVNGIDATVSELHVAVSKQKDFQRSASSTPMSASKCSKGAPPLPQISGFRAVPTPMPPLMMARPTTDVHRPASYGPSHP